MADAAVAGPSLFLVRTENAHREHLHQHNLFHKNKRQSDTATEIDIQQVVTEVVQTVSYIQQIDVDSNGSTFSILTLLAAATGNDAVPATTDASSPATTTDPASPGVTTTASAASSTAAGADSSSASQSLPYNLSTTSTSPSASSIPTSSFALLTGSSNSTTLISSSSSHIRTFANSTITTASSSSTSSFAYLSASSSSSSDDYSYSGSSSSYLSYVSSDSNATPTANGGGAGAGTAATTGSTSTSTGADGSNSGSGSSTSTSTMVGGVVGGVAGAAILIFVLMILLRWKKRHQNMLSLGSGEPSSGGMTSRAITGPSEPPSGGMSGPRSSLFAVPAALASLTGFKRSSRQTDPLSSTDTGEERGFYRVSGRKLPSVFQSGGDGYGDGVVDNTLSGSSFYRDSQGFYGGPGSPTFAPPAGMQRPESGIPVMRPSPARTPVTEHGPFAFNPAPLTPPLRPDLVGRSHPSQDGSHASRFTEEV